MAWNSLVASSVKKCAWSAACLALSAGVASAVPDVIVGDLLAPGRYTPAQNGYWGFAIGTTSCNIGNTTLAWVQNNNRHPVIGQNLYRYKLVGGAGTYEQIGQSWLKHGFTALEENLCSPCVNPDGTGATLDPGCSDPYVASLNGSQSGLGPRFQVNAYTGVYPFPVTGVPAVPGTGAPDRGIARRLQVHESDLIPAMNTGAQYYGEGQYITQDDAQAGNGLNNSSYRKAFVTAISGGGFTIAFQASGAGNATARTQPAIYAWRQSDPMVTLQNIDIAGEGRLIVAYRAMQRTDGQWHYEYVVQNLNSDRSVGSVMVAPSAATGCQTITSSAMRSVRYHSGEPYPNTDWTFNNNNVTKQLSWATETFATNANANAIRWGTSYTFRVISPQAPVAGTMTLGLFKPGTPDSVTANVMVPGLALPPDIDFDNDGVSPATADLDAFLAVFSGGDCPTASCDSIDFNGDGVFPDSADLERFLFIFGGGNPC